MNARSVYLVTEGDYSDYHIIGAYSTRALAERAVEAFGGSIEPWELDRFAHALRAGYRVYFVRMTREGDTVEIRTSRYPSEPDTSVYFSERGNMYTDVMARDDAHAVKIANERRIAVLADDAWGRRGGWAPTKATEQEPTL